MLHVDFDLSSCDASEHPQRRVVGVGGWTPDTRHKSVVANVDTGPSTTS